MADRVRILRLSFYLISPATRISSCSSISILQMSPQKYKREFAQGYIFRSAGTKNSNPVLAECKVHGFLTVSRSTTLHRMKSQERFFSFCERSHKKFPSEEVGEGDLSHLFPTHIFKLLPLSTSPPVSIMQSQALELGRQPASGQPAAGCPYFSQRDCSARAGCTTCPGRHSEEVTAQKTWGLFQLCPSRKPKKSTQDGQAARQLSWGLYFKAAFPPRCAGRGRESGSAGRSPPGLSSLSAPLPDLPYGWWTALPQPA